MEILIRSCEIYNITGISASFENLRLVSALMLSTFQVKRYESIAFVITIDLVSTLSRAGAVGDAKGLWKDTCGQSVS